MLTNINELVPAYSIHPGEILLDELNARKIKQTDFAKLIGYKASQLNEIIKGKRDVNAELALLINNSLGISHQFWLELQSEYDISKVKIEGKARLRLEAIAIWNMIKEYVATSYLKKIGIITGDPIEDIPTIKNLYGIDSVEQFPSLYSNSGYFRKSHTLETNTLNLFAWTKIVTQKAQEIEVKKFNHEKKDELVIKLKEVLRENKDTVLKVTSILSDYGIKLIFENRPDKCAVDAYSFWSNSKPAIGMTLRYKRLDNFAFNLFHELGHVHLHLINNPTVNYVDVDEKHLDYKNSNEELEADLFATDNLINKNAWVFFKKGNTFNDILIEQFAKQQGTHPSIILGRIGQELNIYPKTNILKNLN